MNDGTPLFLTPCSNKIPLLKYRRTILMHYLCKKTCICLEAIRDNKYFEIFSSGSFAVDFCEFGL